MCGYGPAGAGGKQTSAAAGAAAAGGSTLKNLSQEVNYAVCHENVTEESSSGSCNLNNSQQDEGAPNPEDLEVQRVLEGVSLSSDVYFICFGNSSILRVFYVCIIIRMRHFRNLSQLVRLS